MNLTILGVQENTFLWNFIWSSVTNKRQLSQQYKYTYVLLNTRRVRMYIEGTLSRKLLTIQR